MSIAHNIELLAPAGSPEALDAAIGEGADAVYLGLKDFNARLRSTNFTYSQFEGALHSLRRMKKKVYVTVNTVFEQREADRMYQFLKYLEAQGPDAIIVQDFGVIEMVKTEFPSLRLHASTQMNIASARGANALSRHGVSRVVLARELSLDELKSIKNETNLELEVFVHGALCISASGLCLFSSFLGGKSANRGMCTQACRRLFYKNDNLDGEKGYYFSPNDLQLLERVPDLAAAGITALKIEGRMKSASYVGAVVSAYRLVVDAVLEGDEDGIRRSIEQGREILKNDFARPKTQYLFNNGMDFYLAKTQRRKDRKDEDEDEENYEASCNSRFYDWLNPEQDGGTGISLGTVLKIKNSDNGKLALVTPPFGIKPSVRDSVRIHKSDDSNRTTHKLEFTEKSAGSYWISVPENTSSGDQVYLIQTKEMRKRYKPVISHTPQSKGPGRAKAPIPQIEIKRGESFPEGLYVAVSRPEDLYILQSSRPKKVMLTLSRKNAKYILSGNKTLPFKPEEIILTLDPWFPQEIAGYENEIYQEEIKKLTEKGYNQYIVNNPGHFSLFKNFEKVKLITGPWLYTFNSWSLSFAASLSGGSRGADGFISPLENNRQNLMLTTNIRTKNPSGTSSSKNSLLSKFFITVFAWPPLFNTRIDLKPVLKLQSFADNKDEFFSLISAHEGSRVYPRKYFSITDKIPFLKEAGFGRFIIDLCGPALKKSDYRDLIKAVTENTPLPQSSRFNWKDGFYTG